MVAAPRARERLGGGDDGWQQRGGCEFRRDGDEFTFRWPAYRVQARVFGLREERGDTQARLQFSTLAGGHIWIDRVNLWSGTRRSSLVRNLNDMHQLQHRDEPGPSETGWLPLVEQIVHLTLEQWNRPPVLTDLVAAAMEPRPPNAGDLFRGFLPARETSCLYGDGGGGKSMTAMGLSVARLMGVPLGPYIHPVTRGPVVYLDWESTRDEQIDRLLAVTRGLGFAVTDLPLDQFHYHRVFRPIWDEAEWLRPVVARLADPFLVVDSIAYACGGESAVNDDTATRATNALASFENATRLFLAHVTAASTQSDYKGKIRPYGSTFWYNGSRCMWRVQKSKDVLPRDGIALGLFNEKYNNRANKPPLGVRMRFEGPDDGPPHEVRFEGWSVDGDPTLITSLPLPKRIRAYLKRGAWESTELAAELDVSVAVVRATVSRMPDVRTINGGTGRGHTATYQLAAWQEEE